MKVFYAGAEKTLLPTTKSLSIQSIDVAMGMTECIFMGSECEGVFSEGKCNNCRGAVAFSGTAGRPL
jgi:hypothetical protein